MDQKSTLSPEQRADLVAYVDGELDEASAVAIERLLATSTEARRQVEMLTRTFELLDELPRTTTSKEFTTCTLAAIKVENVSPSGSVQATTDDRFAPLRNAAVLTGSLCVVVAAAVLGFLSTNRSLPDDSAVLIRDLPVIENVDKYAEAEDIAFLRALHKSELFDDSQRIPEN